MPKKGTNVFRRKDGRWEGRYTKGCDTSGKRIIGYVYGKTYRETLNKKNAAQELALKEKYRGFDPTLREMAERWYEQESITLKPSTCIKYRRLLNQHIYPKLGEYRCSQIESSVVNDFIQKESIGGNLRTNGRLAPRTVRDITTLIRMIAKYTEINTGIHMELQNVQIPRLKAGAGKVFQSDSLNQLFLAVQSEYQNELRSLGILLCMYTGLRIGELCALKWSDIDMEQGMLYVSRTMQRIAEPCGEKRKTKIIEGEPKTLTSKRMIPLSADIWKILSEFAPHYDREAYFLSGSCKKYIEPRNFQYYFKNFQLRNGIEPLNCHALRHTFATMGIAAGMDIKSLSELLGHSKADITLNYYVHSSVKRKKQQMELLKYV